MEMKLFWPQPKGKFCFLRSCMKKGERERNVDKAEEKRRNDLIILTEIEKIN